MVRASRPLTGSHSLAKVRRPALDLDAPAAVDRFLGGGLHSVPELDNGGVGTAPPGNDVGEFLLCQPIVQSAHADQRTGATLVTQGQCGHLAFLAVAVFRTALLDPLQWDPEHLGGRGLVDLPVGTEYLQHPLLAGQPGDHAGPRWR